MEIYRESEHRSLTETEILEDLKTLLAGYPSLKKVLIIPPDFTRFHSMAGEITGLLWRELKGHATVHVMPALGTHMEMSDGERLKMFGPHIPKACFLTHRWQTDTVSIGRVPADVTEEISGGLFATDIEVEVNKQLLSGGYDLILSVGQVVPHEVVGMANYSKNIFVGIGGRQMINKTHMLGALCGIEEALGNGDAPVRQVFDYAQEHFLGDFPLVYILTVTTRHGRDTHLNGLYIGPSRRPYEEAVKLSQKLNITYLDRPVKKVVTYLDPHEFKTTWVGNKGIYRTRMIIADGGELLILAPGIRACGENPEIDAIIRAYGYRGRNTTLKLYNEGVFENRTMVAAHLIHGSTDGRFQVIYATDPALFSGKEVEAIGYEHMELAKALSIYDPDTLEDGFHTLPDGTDFYFVKAPAMGLWKLSTGIS
ncbi:lactate racemase domain-containing protein [Fretibacterium sp. OH1220_COT-178]|uniref:lactate racemase domain-containing protein n=1 Tax=Fretibacterium sp. OH1220_COT-178 TaxID=2491047 RepID=UPI001F2A343F|nr:lactate racemase domain-containing protein [Fretibacterium sp. OH1220_COT-178]